VRARDPQPLAAALPADSHRAVAEIEIGVVEIDELLDADARGIHQFQDRAVPQAPRCRRPGSGQQPGDLVGREELRQLPRPPRAAERLGRIAANPALPLAEGVEAPQAGELAGDRGRGVARGMQAGGEPPQDRAGGVGRGAAAGRAEKLLELEQILTVALDGERGSAPLSGEVPEKSLGRR
jgi:hypothetical protein